MRKEIYNCVQARWLGSIVDNDEKQLPGEELMNVINFTNYDITYTLVEDLIIVKREIIYPFKCCSLQRIKHNQHVVLSIYDNDKTSIKINRKSINNKLVTLVSTKNPYKYAPGFLGMLERFYIEHLISKSDLLYFD